MHTLKIETPLFVHQLKELLWCQLVWLECGSSPPQRLGGSGGRRVLGVCIRAQGRVRGVWGLGSRAQGFERLALLPGCLPDPHFKGFHAMVV